MKITVRKATMQDLDAIKKIYDNLHTAEENGIITTGWVRGVYPTEDTAAAAIGRGDMFVEEADGEIVGSAIINNEQAESYRGAPWRYAADDDRVTVLHTLGIDPYVKGRGFGRTFVEFYEKYAAENGSPYLRIDTNVKNLNARGFYKKLGFSEIAERPCEFNGIDGVTLVLLEKKI